MGKVPFFQTSLGNFAVAQILRDHCDSVLLCLSKTVYFPYVWIFFCKMLIITIFVMLYVSLYKFFDSKHVTSLLICFCKAYAGFIDINLVFLEISYK